MEHKQSVTSHYWDLLYKVAYRFGFTVVIYNTNKGLYNKLSLFGIYIKSKIYLIQLFNSNVN